MMFDVMKARAQLFFRDAKHACEFVSDVAHFRGVTESILDLPRVTRNTHRSKQNLLV